MAAGKAISLMVISLFALAQPAWADGKCEDLAEAAKADDTSRMAELIESGVNANCTYRWSHEFESGKIIAGTETPLHQAARSGEIDAIKMLLGHGADVNARSDDGDTPLHDASGTGKADAAGTLLRNGADVNARDKDGKTPLHDAVWSDSPATVSTLLRHGAKVNAQDNEGNTPTDEVMVVEFAAWFDEYGDPDAIDEVIHLLKEAGGMPNKLY